MLSKAIAWVRNWFGSFSSKNENPHRVRNQPSVHTIGTKVDERNYRLAEIARERKALIENKAEILRRRKPFYRLLRDLRDEEMRLELGR